MKRIRIRFHTCLPVAKKGTRLLHVPFKLIKLGETGSAVSVTHALTLLVLQHDGVHLVLER